MTAQETRALVNAALADPTVDLAIPLGLSLALREGLRATVLSSPSRGDHHPAVGDVPGSLILVDAECLAGAAPPSKTRSRTASPSSTRPTTDSRVVYVH
jgi:hypothetical protein